MLDLLFQNPILFFIWGISLVIAVTIHEFSHAFVADKLGDPTPKAYGRLSLNPLAHLDPLGTLAILIANIGWGKPVPVDSYNFANPKRDTLLVSLAGPASNFILAVILSLLMLFFPVTSILAVPMIILNVGLGIFNLIPIPPLDGSKILAGLLNNRQAFIWEQISNTYGFYLLLILVLPFFGGQSLLGTLISPLISLIVSLLIP